MTLELADLVPFYRLPAGRAAFALTKVSALARAHGAPTIAEVAEATVAQALALRDLELSRRRPSNAVHGPQATPLDRREDRLIHAIDGTLETHAEAGTPELQPLAAELRLAIFPKGAYALTQLPYVEQHATVSRILVILQGPKAELVEKLGLTPFVKRLAEVNEAYGAELYPAGQGATQEVIQAARQALHRKVLEVIVRTLGTWPDDAGAYARTDVLAPLIAQSTALAEHYRSSRGESDVDPKSGEPVAPTAER